ncbi:hypothetical protein GPJ56_006662 [Histomonas meleagridis]|uniref:uncharacterized protein n=1 Tax=Histomonas meleagridis TaxID=135588 RepID=UPI00355A784E|nr:hypothetical protein GPJ56_006662 [Histomonas meleagridis]KAH0805995.1 hypothetical protein GO595_001243 [Histomonas meleagridis]
MSSRAYKFRPIERRTDAGDIKSRCYDTSEQATDSKFRQKTNYRIDYVPYPLERRSPAKAPPTGIYIGGDEVTPDDYKSNYQRTFHTFPETSMTKPAEPIPSSKIITSDTDTTIPLTTQQEANNQIIHNRPTYDNAEAKRRIADARRSHFINDEPIDYHTQYQTDFHPFDKNYKPSVIDNQLLKSSIVFSTPKQYGPHPNHHKKEKVPSIGDAPKPDHLKINFDIGYSKPSYETTYNTSHPQTKNFTRPETVKAPPCAPFPDYGSTPRDWISDYSERFVAHPDCRNIIDKNDLKSTHWDVGHDPTDYHRPELSVATTKPRKEFIDLQQSSEVFKGDGTMSFHTTQNDLTGVYDRTQSCRCDADVIDARSDHLFFGGEKTDYTTEVKESQKLAGKGKPAKPSENLHLMKSTGFARGGNWDTFYGDDPVSEKRYKREKPAQKIDGKYFMATHFDLDATDNRKSCYETTYFEDICKPKIY